MTEVTAQALIRDRFEQVRERVDRACARVGRPADSVRIIAVSKAHPPEAIRAAHAVGLRCFGENYAQELQRKAEDLRDLTDLRFRFVGHLQRNKIRAVLSTGATVDTVDSERLGDALAHRGVLGSPVELLVQVNIGREGQKSGCLPEEASDLVGWLKELPGLDVRGLMAVAPQSDSPELARPHFAALRELGESLRLEELSMGMTSDFEVAVEEGATMVRIGTAIFGPRPQR